MRTSTATTYSYRPEYADTIHVSQLTVQQIKATPLTPQVRYHENINLMWISGNSIKPANSDVLMSAVDIAVDHLSEKGRLRLVLDLKRINASAVKALMNLFNQLKNQQRFSREIHVTWMIAYQDDEMLEMAVDFMCLFGVKIEIRPY